MAEIKVIDLPLIADEDFTSNDRFIIIDDGVTKQMTRSTLYNWMIANVQGEKGDQGVSGRDGLDGSDGQDGQDGINGLSAYQIAVAEGFNGTQQEWIESLGGIQGLTGEDGEDGWSPVLQVSPRGSDYVLQIVDWIGGAGTKPTRLGYLSTSGIVTNISLATNIKGSKGDRGDTGATGATGAKGADGQDGVDGKTIASIKYQPNSSILITNTDATTVLSNTPPKKFGWGVYRDGQYGQTNPLTIAVNNTAVLPNNAVTTIEKMPDGYSTFYNPTTQKVLLQDSEGWYTIRVKFKVAASNQPSYLNLSMSDGTTQLTYIEDKSLRGDNQIQYVDLTCEQYGNAALASNGLTISVKAFDRAISIYDVEIAIAKII